MAKDPRQNEGLALLGRAVSKRGGGAEQVKAQADIENVIKHFKDDPTAWKQLADKLNRASSDDERARLLIDFAVSEDALRRMLPGDDTVAATPTVTTVTVTTVTTV